MNKMGEGKKRILRRGTLWSGLATIAALISAVGVGLALFFVAGNQAHQASSNGVFPQTIFGILLYEGFRDGSHFGVHVFPGVLVLPAFVLVVAVLSSALAIRSFVATKN